MAKISYQRIKDYVRDGGMQCVICSSGDLNYGSFDAEGTIVTQNVKCITCGASWVDFYHLEDIKDLSCNNEPVRIERKVMITDIHSEDYLCDFFVGRLPLTGTFIEDTEDDSQLDCVCGEFTFENGVNKVYFHAVKLKYLDEESE